MAALAIESIRSQSSACSWVRWSRRSAWNEQTAGNERSRAEARDVSFAAGNSMS